MTDGAPWKCDKCGERTVYSAESVSQPCEVCGGTIDGPGWECRSCNRKLAKPNVRADHAIKDREIILEKAHAEAHTIRERAAENADAIKRQAEAHQLSEWDERIRAKKKELEEWGKKIGVAIETFNREMRMQAAKRDDRALWELPIDQLRMHFAYEEDPDERTELVIGVLIVRGHTDEQIADALFVTPARVRKVRSGAGDPESVLEFLSGHMGPRPDGHRPPSSQPTAASSAATLSKTASVPKEREALVHAAALRLYDENKSVREVSRETGRSVGWAAKARREWSARKPR